MLSAATLLIIVLVISQEDEIMATPMAVFQKMLLPCEIRPGLAPPIKIKNPPQTKSIAAAGGIRPIKTKSIIFFKSLNKSHLLQGSGLTEVPHGTRGHQETACAKTGKKTKISTRRTIIFLP